MPEQPLISVIIPVYNLENEISKTLDSVCRQSYNNIQIIAVNDGSTDSSLNVCRRYAAGDSRITVINKSNEGLPAARRDGLNAAKGAYIHHLDGGDYINSDTYRILVDELCSSNFPDVAVFGFYYVFNNKTEKSQPYPSTVRSPLDMLKHIWTTQQYNAVWQYIHKRELAREIIFYENINLSEDTWYTSQLLYNAGNIKITNNYLYCYVANEGSMTRTVLSDKHVSSIIFVSEQVDRYMSSKPQYRELAFELLALKLQSYATVILGGRLENMKQFAMDFNDAFRKYPQLETAGVIKRVRKIVKLYVRNRLLYHIMLKYYRLKGKIR